MANKKDDAATIAAATDDAAEVESLPPAAKGEGGEAMTDKELGKIQARIELATADFAAMAADSGQFKITWRGSPNYWVGRNTQKAVAICDHIMQASEESADGWFKNVASEVSAHFGVARDGRIYQWVRTENTAWANGILQDPNMAIDWLNHCVSYGINPNLVTISIEHEGYSGKPFTEIQYLATLWLHRYLCNTYDIKPTSNNIVGHNQITAKDRANCPGKAFPWTRLLGDLSDLLAPDYKPPTNNPYPFDPNPNHYTVGEGILAEMTARKEVANGKEEWYTPKPGQEGLLDRSFCWSTNSTQYEAFQTEKGWDIRVFPITGQAKNKA